MGKKQDLTGKVFGRWTVIKQTEQREKNGAIIWKCVCQCGNIGYKSSRQLNAKMSLSCGCYSKEQTIKTHTTHNMSYTRLYHIYGNMKQRCYNCNNTNYSKYGGRGITICDEWLNDIQKFFEWALSHGYNDKLSIDRIDNNKGYSADNCRWETSKTQMSNTRRNRYIEFNGERLTLSEWSRRVGITRASLLKRIDKLGWSIEKALTQKASEQMR